MLLLKTVKRCSYLKWTMIVLIVIIVARWCNYFCACLQWSKYRYSNDSNHLMDFIRWVRQFTDGEFMGRSYLYDSEYYLLDFGVPTLLLELAYVILLIVAIRREKKRSDMIVLCGSVGIFLVLGIFESSTR